MNKAQKCLSAARTAPRYPLCGRAEARPKVLNIENLSLNRRLHSLDPIHSKVKATPQQPRSAADPRPPQFNAAFDKL